MASIFDVARYIIIKLGDKEQLTTLKLQKLCYYSQAWSLAWDDVPLFEDDFEAWANGPVNTDLYNEHKGLFTAPSTLLADKGNPNLLTKTEEETVDAVLDYYGKKSPHWLSETTHNEAPWRDAREGLNPTVPSKNIISKESMKEYYGGLI